MFKRKRGATEELENDGLFWSREINDVEEEGKLRLSREQCGHLEQSSVKNRPPRTCKSIYIFVVFIYYMVCCCLSFLIIWGVVISFSLADALQLNLRR